MLVHVDTDLGSNPDDACALAMLLGTPGLRLTGITTTVDPGGLRAGMVHELLRLAGRAGVPVAAGAEATLGARDTPGEIPVGPPWWPRPVVPRPAPPGAALDLLTASLDAGATLAAIGPFTDLAVLETLRPGSLRRAPVVLMGGWVGRRLPHGFPAWEADRDWNVQCDPDAFRVVLDAAEDLTLVTIAATIRVPVRAADLPPMRAAGPVGELLARQTRAYGARNHAGLGARWPRLPDDLLNFHHDPLACAVATGWGADLGRVVTVRAVTEHGVLRLEPDPRGRPVRVVDDVDAAAFRAHWFDCLRRVAGDASG